VNQKVVTELKESETIFPRLEYVVTRHGPHVGKIVVQNNYDYLHNVSNVSIAKES
jgi:hypothetical protein